MSARCSDRIANKALGAHAPGESCGGVHETPWPLKKFSTPRRESSSTKPPENGGSEPWRRSWFSVGLVLAVTIPGDRQQLLGVLRVWFEAAVASELLLKAFGGEMERNDQMQTRIQALVKTGLCVEERRTRGASISTPQ